MSAAANHLCALYGLNREGWLACCKTRHLFSYLWPHALSSWNRSRSLSQTTNAAKTAGKRLFFISFSISILNFLISILGTPSFKTWELLLFSNKTSLNILWGRKSDATSIGKISNSLSLPCLPTVHCRCANQMPLFQFICACSLPSKLQRHSSPISQICSCFTTTSSLKKQVVCYFLISYILCFLKGCETRWYMKY